MKIQKEVVIFHPSLCLRDALTGDKMIVHNKRKNIQL